MRRTVSCSPTSGYRPRKRRPVEERELEAAAHRALGLPLQERLRLYEVLKADLSGELGVEGAAEQQVRARREALSALEEAGRLLELEEGEVPTVAEYDRIAQAHRLAKTSSQIRAAFGRWEVAIAALVGDWVPLVPAQRAIRRANNSHPRREETYVEAVRLWLRSQPVVGGRDDYDAWVRLENQDRLQQNDLPLPSYRSVNRALMVSWDRVLRVARGELTVQDARDEQLGFDFSQVRPGTLITTNGVAQLLGLTSGGVHQLARRPEFPKRVARVRRRPVWFLADVLAYRGGRPFLEREELSLDGAYVTGHEVAHRIGQPENRLRGDTWRQQWGRVPEPVPVVGELLVWDRTEVEDWCARRQAERREEEEQDQEEEHDPAQSLFSVTADLEVLARRVRVLREERGLSQQGLADRAGIRQSQISRLESARIGEPSLATLVRVANAFEVSLDALLGVGEQQVSAKEDETASCGAVELVDGEKRPTSRGPTERPSEARPQSSQVP